MDPVHRFAFAILVVSLYVGCGGSESDNKAGAGGTGEGALAAGRGGDAPVAATTGGAGGTTAAVGGMSGAPLVAAGSSGTDPAVVDVCQKGCEATLSAKCAISPADQATCVADCLRLEISACGTQYLALQTCALGKPVTCGPAGIPTIATCETQQNAFLVCLNG